MRRALEDRLGNAVHVLADFLVVLFLPSRTLRFQRRRQRIEKLPAWRRQRSRHLRERPLRIILKRRARQRREHGAAEIERA
jgi:hypothetical protein